MWTLLSSRFRRWLLLVVGAPLLARLLYSVADGIERRSTGGSTIASLLRGTARVIPGNRRWNRTRRQL